MRQEMQWGYIDWIYAEERKSENPMNIGVCVIYPGGYQEQHIHYSEEQFIYITKGESTQYVNGVCHELRAGMHLYMEAGCAHAMYNTGDSPVYQLLISTPVSYRELTLSEDLHPEGGNIHGAVEAIRNQLLMHMYAPFTIFDESWHIVYQNKYFLDFCIKRCNPLSGRSCVCLEKTGDLHNTDGDFRLPVCPWGMTVYHLPIKKNGEVIGTLRGGHFFVSNGRKMPPKGVYDTPKSTAIGVRKLLERIRSSILAYLAFDDTRKTLHNQRNIILETREHQQNLEKELYLTQETVTNLKINNHFLFNTLNCMAEMALSEKGEDLYDAIIDLAQMLRARSSDPRFLMLKEEIDFLHNYIRLQKLRYGQRLIYEENIDKSLLTVCVPSNFLQPIAENAFVHGFRQFSEEMHLILNAFKDGNRLAIHVINNGAAVNADKCRQIMHGIRRDSGHGLSLINSKLTSVYGRDFEMGFESQADDNLTRVLVNLPLSLPG